jgi:hypothetical protein
MSKAQKKLADINVLLNFYSNFNINNFLTQYLKSSDECNSKSLDFIIGHNPCDTT